MEALKSTFSSARRLRRWILKQRELQMLFAFSSDGRLG